MLWLKLRKLNSSDPETRIEAIDDLCHYDADHVVMHIRKALDDDNERVRAAAKIAIHRIGCDHTVAQPPLGTSNDTTLESDLAQPANPSNTWGHKSDSTSGSSNEDRLIDWLLAPAQGTSIRLSHVVSFNERNIDGLLSLASGSNSSPLSQQEFESIAMQFVKSQTAGNLSHAMVAEALRLAPLPQMRSCVACGASTVGSHAAQSIECAMNVKYSSAGGLLHLPINVDWKHTANAKMHWPLCSDCFTATSVVYPRLVQRLKACNEPFFVRHPLLAYMVPNARRNAQQTLRQRLAQACSDVITSADSILRDRQRLILPAIGRYAVELNLRSFGTTERFLGLDQQKGAFGGQVRSSLDIILPSQKFATGLFSGVDFPSRFQRLGMTVEHKWRCTGTSKAKDVTWQRLIAGQSKRAVQFVADTLSATTKSPVSASVTDMVETGDPVAKLKQLKQMRDAGLIEQEEYEATKNRILGTM